MRKPIAAGALIRLSSFSSENAKTVTVKEVLGEGAGSIAYLVEEDGISYILKECFPYYGADRSLDGTVLWRSSAMEEKSKIRFQKSLEVQVRLMENLDSMNQTAHLTGSLYQANNTFYTLVVRKNASTYDSVRETSLEDIFVTARSVAGIIRAYHKMGYLHLDIKPSNILVYPETREMIQMIDFDSIIRISEKGLCSPSFSPQYAPPELLALDTANICEASDLYEIGAIIFEKIFGRTPESLDRSVFSRWDYPGLYDKKSEKLKRLSDELFRKTLAAGVKDRFRNMDELIQCLNTLILESLNKVYLVSTLPESKNNFVGRIRETCDIEKAFEGSKVVVLSGIGGIGKTELALHYSKKNRSRYDVICFGKVIDTLEKLFNDPDSSFLSIKGENRNDLHGIRKIDDLADQHTLLIIDNLDSLDDPMIPDLFSLKCRILITSRCDFHEEYPQIPQIAVEELSSEDQFRLFLVEAGGAGDGCDPSVIRGILSEINGYTLLIPLIAKLLPKSLVTPEELYNRIHSAGIARVPDTKIRQYKDVPLKGSVISILRTVLDMSRFTEDEHIVLKSILLFEGIYIEKTGLLRVIGEEYNDSINDLAESGWLQIHGTFPHQSCSMHSILSQIYALDHRPHLTEMEWVKRVCEDYAKECDQYTEQVLDGTIDSSIESLRDEPFSKDQDYAYLDQNRIWHAVGTKAYYFIHRRETIAALLQNCTFQNDDDIACLLDILDLITANDLSRACNFTDGDYGIDYLKSRTESKSLNTRCIYCQILFILRDLALERLPEQGMRAKAVEKLSELTAQYCNTVLTCPGMESSNSFASICNVLQFYFDLGGSYGIGLFRPDWNSVSNLDEEQIERWVDTGTAQRFAGIVDELVIILKSSFPENYGKNRQNIEKDLLAFREGMSAEKYLDYQLHRWDDYDDSDIIIPYDNSSDSYKLWDITNDGCRRLIRECRELGFDRDPDVKKAGRIQNGNNQNRAEELLSALEHKLKIISEILKTNHDLPPSAETEYDDDLAYCMFSKSLLYAAKGNVREAVLTFTDYFTTCGDLLFTFSSDIDLLAFYKPYCDRTCILRMANILYDRFPSYVQAVADEAGPYEINIPEIENQMQLYNINTELRIAELMEDAELQCSIKQKRNELMNTIF